MDPERKKNIKALQSSDGTFELVIDNLDLEDLSEEEVSFAEEIQINEGSPKKSKVPMILIFALIPILVIGIVSAFFIGQKKSDIFSEAPLPKVQGFKAYGGNHSKRAMTRKKSQNAISKPDRPKIERAEIVEEKVEPSYDDKEVVWGDREEKVAEIPIARIQANRNPSLETLRAKEEAERGSDEIDDTNDDSKEIENVEKMKLLGNTTLTPKDLDKLKDLVDVVRPEIDLKEIPLNLPNLKKIKLNVEANN